MAQRKVSFIAKSPEGEDIVREYFEEYDTGDTELVVHAGERWGLRPDECLWLEAAFQRRRCERIESRLTELELIIKKAKEIE